MNKNIAMVVGGALVGALIFALFNAIMTPKTPSLGPKPCNQGTCPIDVNVYVDCSVSNNILASPERAPIKKGNKDPVIEWTIYKSGYTFAANGIDFKGDTQFHDPKLLGDGKRFQWSDTNSDSDPHKYTINLLYNGTPCPPLDPGIINGQ